MGLCCFLFKSKSSFFDVICKIKVLSNYWVWCGVCVTRRADNSPGGVCQVRRVCGRVGVGVPCEGFVCLLCVSFGRSISDRGDRCAQYFSIFFIDSLQNFVMKWPPSSDRHKQRDLFKNSSICRHRISVTATTTPRSHPHHSSPTMQLSLSRHTTAATPPPPSPPSANIKPSRHNSSACETELSLMKIYNRMADMYNLVRLFTIECDLSNSTAKPASFPPPKRPLCRPVAPSSLCITLYPFYCGFLHSRRFNV